MGSTLETYIYNEDPEELDSYHTDYQTQLRDRYGYDTYAGHLGAIPFGLDIIHTDPFETYNEALEYLEENHCKWDCAMAIPFKGKIRVLSYIVGAWCPE